MHTGPPATSDRRPRRRRPGLANATTGRSPQRRNAPLQVSRQPDLDAYPELRAAIRPLRVSDAYLIRPTLSGITTNSCICPNGHILRVGQGRACQVDVTLSYRIVSASKEVFGALFLLRLAGELSIAVSTAPDGGGASTSEDEKLTPIIQEVSYTHVCLPADACRSIR